MNFGALRVLNDDIVAAGEGFGTHPHRDMEIIVMATAFSFSRSTALLR
jgi:redox-sensitive bicupin YhaK (pirin superfamily)